MPSNDDLTKQVRILENELALLREKNLDLVQTLEKQTFRSQEVEKRLSINPITGLPTHYQMNSDLMTFFEARKNENDRVWMFVLLQLNHTLEMVKRSVKPTIVQWLLYQVAQRLREHIDSHDLLYQTRENEFLLVVALASKEDSVAALERVNQNVQDPHTFSGFHFRLEANMGVALFPEDGVDKTAILHHADISLRKAQEVGKPYVMFQTELLAQIVEKMELQNSIYKAMEPSALREIGHQFDLHFQPKLSLQHIVPDKAVVSKIDAEALLRWHHPTKGLIPPDLFIPVAEESGLILPIGKWCLFQVLKKMKAWQNTELQTCNVAINISSRQYHSPEFYEIVRSAIEEYGVEASRLTFEISEASVFEHWDVSVECLERFRALGIRISVDDYGTGTSSLHHLRTFPFDELKIDHSFTQSFPENHPDRSIVKTLIALARELNLTVVAEGVERVDQALELFAMGCPQMQGFVFSKPLTEAAFSRFVKNLTKNESVFPFS